MSKEAFITITLKDDGQTSVDLSNAEHASVNALLRALTTAIISLIDITGMNNKRRNRAILLVTEKLNRYKKEPA